MAVTRLHVINMIILLVAGLVILLLSLLTANTLSMRSAGVNGAQWRFYLGRDILPDNVLYPVLMVRDKLRLDMTDPHRQVALKLAYADERFKTAESLRKEKQDLLAISTLTKSQKYVISAGYQALELQFDKEQLQQVRNAVASSVDRLDEFSKQPLSVDQAILLQLKEETRILLLQIDERLAAS